MRMLPLFEKRMMPRVGSGREKGAVLYVALIILVLLALIGIAGIQVSGMQEKMASNYRAVNRAFEEAEGTVRDGLINES